MNIESTTEAMRTMARCINAYVNPDGAQQVGFVLLVFPFEAVDLVEGVHRCNYISNTTRGDVIKIMREQLTHFERGMDIHPQEEPPDDWTVYA